MGTRAWNDDGEVGQYRWMLFGAARKALLHYGGIVTSLAKITLNGMTYDIKRQAKEGLVVITEGYTKSVFFLPENREPMTAEQGQSLNIKTYFQMLSETDYAEIPAWDYFVAQISNLVGTLDNPEQEFSYVLKNDLTGTVDIVAQGAVGLYGVTTFKQLMQNIYESMTVDIEAPLTEWMVEDGTVCFRLEIDLPEYSLPFWMGVGRK